MDKKPICLYRVYFEQVNQTRFDIKARSTKAAYEKAKRQWRAEYASPQLGCGARCVRIGPEANEAKLS